MSKLIESLNWRYATKDFDADKKLSADQLNSLVESLRLTPSSFGLQAWNFVIIGSDEIKNELKPASFNQNQITDCSHLIVFTTPKIVNDEQVDEYIEHMAKVREVDPTTLDGFKGYLSGFIANKSEDEIYRWLDNQVYIALGNLLTSAAMLGIDTCAIEGFKPSEYDRILQLEKMGLRSVVTCAVGFRSESDKYATAKKVRFPTKRVTHFL